MLHAEMMCKLYNMACVLCARLSFIVQANKKSVIALNFSINRSFQNTVVGNIHNKMHHFSQALTSGKQVLCWKCISCVAVALCSGKCTPCCVCPLHACDCYANYYQVISIKTPSDISHELHSKISHPVLKMKCLGWFFIPFPVACLLVR